MKVGMGRRLKHNSCGSSPVLVRGKGRCDRQLQKVGGKLAELLQKLAEKCKIKTERTMSCKLFSRAHERRHQTNPHFLFLKGVRKTIAIFWEGRHTFDSSHAL